ncbi:regulator of chromosome condensation 1/beta-lactamase-inhibitor protein II [Baffinella frigidus]|nr:regulator of chromosome condensation 1/beta-lactamase-inhibitor protein II [Cryptophyta sp. CCMP2293]
MDIPAEMRGRVSDVACGDSHTLLILADGKVWASCSDRSGGSSASPRKGVFNHTPTRVLCGFEDVIAVASGEDHSLAMTASGKVLGWGRGKEGQLGSKIFSSDVKELTGTELLPKGKPLAIAAGGNCSVVMLRDVSGGLNLWWLGKCPQAQKPTPADVASTAGGPTSSQKLTFDARQKSTSNDSKCAGGEGSLAVGGGATGGAAWAYGVLPDECGEGMGGCASCRATAVMKRAMLQKSQ